MVRGRWVSEVDKYVLFGSLREITGRAFRAMSPTVSPCLLA
jgi:hypothetical protein